MATHSSTLAMDKNPTDRGVWRATAHRVAQSQRQLKCLIMHVMLPKRQIQLILKTFTQG